METWDSGDHLSTVSAVSGGISRRYQQVVDKSVPHVWYRWMGLLSFAVIYAVRVYLIQRLYSVTYFLALYSLLEFLFFLSPADDPDFEHPILPTRQSDEFRPFDRLLPQFLFWYSLTKAFLVAFCLTFSPYDLPASWRLPFPILFSLWMMFFVGIMSKPIIHMIKYRYVPVSFGKQRYDRKTVTSTGSAKPPRD